MSDKLVGLTCQKSVYQKVKESLGELRKVDDKYDVYGLGGVIRYSLYVGVFSHPLIIFLTAMIGLLYSWLP